MNRTYTNATWRVGRKELLAMAAGIVLFGLLSWISNFANLAGTVGADIRPAVAIPIIFGFIFGPTVGFVTGMFGNMAYDFLYGYIPSPPMEGSVYATSLATVTATYYLNWQIGNGISGLVPGIMALYHRRYLTWGDQFQALIYMVLGIGLGIGFAAVTDTFIYTDYSLQYSLEAQFVPIFTQNLLSVILFVPIVLYNYARRDLFSREMLSSGLLRRLVGLLIVTAGIPTILLSFFLYQQDLTNQAQVAQIQALEEFIASGETQAAVEGQEPAVNEDTTNSVLIGQVFIVILISSVVVLVNAVLISQSISRPLLLVTDAARQMQLGKLSLARAKELKETPATDEVSQLSSMFGSMATEVLAREEALKQQLESLKIEVDLVKQNKQVSEITETDFFRDLQNKAKHMRTREAGNTGLVPIIAMPESRVETEETHPPSASLLTDEEEEPTA
jgi:HAMP domain-containing protein